MVDVEVLFPLAEEGFDVPSQLIDGHEFFGSEVKAVSRQPACFRLDPVSDDSDLFFGEVDTFRAEKYDSIIKNRAVRSGIILVETGFS